MTNKTFNIRQSFLKGSVWNILGLGTGQILKFGKNLLLTRLLFPEAYGVMSIVWAIMFATNMLSDAGLETAALRHSKGDQEHFLNNVWTAKIIRGAILFFITCTIAYPASIIYGKTELLWLLPVAGIASLIDELGSTNLYLLKRKMEYRLLTYLEISNEIIMAIVTISWAYFSPGYMALLVGALFGSVYRATCSHTLLPGFRNKISWDTEILKELFHFGKWVLLASSIYLICVQGDRFFLGLYIDSATLGVYSVAIMMSEVVGGLASRLNGSVVFSTLNRVQHDGAEKMKAVLYKIRLIFDVAFIFPFGILAMLSSTIIYHLYDSRYHAAGGMLKILCIRLVMTTMICCGESCMLVLGQPRLAIWQNAGRALWLVIGIPLAFANFGFQGAIFVIATSEIPSFFVFWPALRREGLLSLPLELRSLAFLATGLFAGGLTLYVLQRIGFTVV